MSSGYLLDSQVLMWVNERPSRLGKNATQILKFQDLFYSTISIAELGFKSKSGKLQFGKLDIERWHDLGMGELAFGRSAASEFASFHSHQVPDPMDRQIMAVARANGLGLVTADRKILALNLDWVIDATT
jgi:PIN domain nuclease of toxin-antitoxin system